MFQLYYALKPSKLPSAETSCSRVTIIIMCPSKDLHYRTSGINTSQHRYACGDAWIPAGLKRLKDANTPT